MMRSGKFNFQAGKTVVSLRLASVAQRLSNWNGVNFIPTAMISSHMVLTVDSTVRRRHRWKMLWRRNTRRAISANDRGRDANHRGRDANHRGIQLQAPQLRGKVRSSRALVRPRIRQG